MPQKDINSMVDRLSRPMAQTHEKQFEKVKKQAASRYQQKPTKSYMTQASRQMTESLQPIQDRADYVLSKKKAWVEQEQQAKADQVEATFHGPRISRTAQKKTRSLADLMRWQTQKQQNRKTGAAEKAKMELAMSSGGDKKFFNSRCSEIMSIERLFQGNRE
eukprot:TRINITY_DN23600_c0_g2_i1.p1 TRINITY_DN23600_c0_g2~~TRINITY_DN23600_c0_g2_i1.p1  ORF type:complete len:162 (-),score=55.09 TRINITY_DN23600_c0_g2_i1:188-673(-)